MKLSYLLAFLPIFLISCQGIDLSKVSDKDIERISNKFIVCEKPYIRYGSDCCLDNNNNSICDDDDLKLETKTQNISKPLNDTTIIDDTKLSEPINTTTQTKDDTKTKEENNTLVIKEGCGDGICGVYEDYDICPADCKRPLNTIYDVIDVIKKTNNSENFIMIYTPLMAEYPLIVRLKEYLGIPLKDAKEITDFNTKNLILFGASCTNPITAQFKEFGTCDELINLCEGGAGSGGYIKMIDNNGKKVISLQGCQEADTEALGRAILDYQNNYFYLYTTDYKFGVMKR